MKKLLIILIMLLAFMGCTVPEAETEIEPQMEISIVGFVQEVNCGGEVYRLGRCCPECPECEVCETCETCEVCEICQECEVCPEPVECEECCVDPCCSYFALGDLFVDVKINNSGEEIIIEDIEFGIRFNDNSTISMKVPVDISIGANQIKTEEIQLIIAPFNKRVIFVEII